MKYLPVLEELFESDTVIIMLIGLVIALLAGVRLKGYKKPGIAAGISLLIYGVCEAASNLHGSYMMQFILLFLGTAAIGCMAGFGIRLMLTAISRH